MSKKKKKYNFEDITIKDIDKAIKETKKIESDILDMLCLDLQDEEAQMCVKYLLEVSSKILALKDLKEKYNNRNMGDK